MRKIVAMVILFSSLLNAEATCSLSKGIKDSLVDYQDFPVSNIVFRDISPILENTELYHKIIDHFYEHYKGAPVDAVVAVEARGFLFGAPLAYKLQVPLVMVRKEGKLPGEVYRASYKKMYGEDRIVMRKKALKPGQQVVIIDDFFSTGGTLQAVAQLVQAAGANVYEGAFLIDNREVQKLSFNFPIYSIAVLEKQ